jgi:NADH dehydrogenase
MPALAVTGAGGFVGRHLTAAAVAAGWGVVGVVRSEPAATRVREAGGRPVLAGLEPAALAAAFRGAQAVVHLAQVGAERGGATYEAVNLGGTRAVVEAARRAGVGRIVFLSGLGVARYGMERRCSNPYFLSKLACELELFRSGLTVAVFRPSYVLGPGGELVSGLLRELAAGEVEVIGNGGYRMQPIAVGDAAALVLAAAQAGGTAVFDLVGPEPVSYRGFVDRLARLAAERGRPAAYRVRQLPAGEADRQAAAGGYRGLLRDELDCLLCDQVGEAAPLEALLGRALTPLDQALDRLLGAVAP